MLPRVRSTPSIFHAMHALTCTDVYRWILVCADVRLQPHSGVSVQAAPVPDTFSQVHPLHTPPPVRLVCSQFPPSTPVREPFDRYWVPQRQRTSTRTAHMEHWKYGYGYGYGWMDAFSASYCTPPELPPRPGWGLGKTLRPYE